MPSFASTEKRPSKRCRRRRIMFCAMLALKTFQVCAAFSVPNVRSFSTALYGVRTALRRNFPSKRSNKLPSSSIVVVSSMDATQDAEENLLMASQEAFIKEEDIITLPPIEDGRQLTNIEEEFREIMGQVAELSPSDISALPSARLRAIADGARAGAGIAAVYRAFEVLFADFLPLRLAGRKIFQKILKEVEKARLVHNAEVEEIADSTGICPKEIEMGRFAFLKLAQHQDEGEAYLSVEELVETGVATTMVELLGFEDYDDLLSELDEDQTGKLTFEKIMVGLQRCSASGPTSRDCNATAVLQELSNRLESLSALSSTTDESKKKAADRYEHMLETFVEWENRVPTGEGRRLDILRGCFVGAGNPKVVEALKIVYCDYSALRIAGDVIFGIVTKLMKNSK